MVEVQDVTKVSQGISDILKKQETIKKVEVGNIDINFEIESKGYSNINEKIVITAEEVKPWVSWSEGLLNSEEFKIILGVVAQLYQNDLNKNSKDQYIVKALPLTQEELVKFIEPVFYHIDDNGFLEVNCHLEVHNINEATKGFVYYFKNKLQWSKFTINKRISIL